MFPGNKEIEKAILTVLIELGGKENTQIIYRKVTALFPQLTENDLTECVSQGKNKWINKLQFRRATLILKGEMEKKKIHGMWEISEKGRERIRLGT